MKFWGVFFNFIKVLVAFCIASGAKLSFASVYKLESISDSYTGLDDCLRDDERRQSQIVKKFIFFV